MMHLSKGTRSSIIRTPTSEVFGIPLLLVLLAQQLQAIAATVTIDDAKACNADIPPIDFVYYKGDANAEAIEDELRADLEKIGLTIRTRELLRADYDAARFRGDFGLCFSEGWGAPYDPHSFVSAWEADNVATAHALENMEPPATKAELLAKIEDVLQEEDKNLRQTKWTEVHDYYHQQAVMLPLWGRRVVAIINSRLAGYTPGHQQFDFPVHKLVPIEGEKTVTISPGSNTGRFENVGEIDPHTYSNEFFANNWIYEGLVEYGPNGQVLPSLAKSWTEEETPEGGMRYTFQLRENVSFHDGAPWNCRAAKMNLDHVLAGALVEPEWHGWYGVPKYLKDWTCASDTELVMTTSVKFYPFLQELTYIRPIRFMSPNAFAEGPASDRYTANSCEKGWGTLEGEDGTTVVCKGISNVTGTGPFVFVSRESDVVQTADYNEVRVDEEVVFRRNANYWGKVPEIETLKIVRYADAPSIEAALLDGSLDVMWGDGVLPANTITKIANMDGDTNLNVFIGEDVQNVVLLLNSQRPPLDDFRVRKAIIHAIDKKRMIDKELGGFLKPVDSLFPRSMPYCDVDLTPHWDYDLEKAMLLSCDLEGPAVTAASKTAAENDRTLALGLGLGLGFLSLFAIGVAVVYFQKNKALEAKYVKNDSGVQA